MRVFLTYCLCALPVFAATDDSVLLIHDGKTEIANEVAQSLSQRLPGNNTHIEIVDLSNQTLPENTVLENYSTIITLGSQPAEIALEKAPQTHLLSLLISKQTWSIIKKQQSAYPRSVIFLDQPIDRQLRMIREIFGNESKTGTILGPFSSSLEMELNELAKKHQQKIYTQTIQDPDELIPVLGNLTEKIDLLLAEPDAVVYNKRSIQGILLLTYRSKTPVIGFSESYSRAGAMASLYSNIDNIAQQAAELILEKPSGNNAYSPKYFSISFNHQVARTLGIALPDEKELVERITKKESSHQ